MGSSRAELIKYCRIIYVIYQPELIQDGTDLEPRGAGVPVPVHTYPKTFFNNKNKEIF